MTWADIEEDVDFEAVLDELGIGLAKVTSKGWRNMSCPLPAHPGADKNPSFGVNEFTKMFNCFACDEQGSLAKLWSILREVNYEQALTEIAELCGIVLDSDDDAEATVAINTWINKTFVDQPKVIEPRGFSVLPFFHPEALHGLPYAMISKLEKWGIKSPQTIRAFEIRYDAQRTRFGYTGSALIVPHWIDGELIGWQERWLGEDAPKRWTNTVDFPRDTTLFNYSRARALQTPVILVEAAMTAVRLHELEYTAVASFGAQLHESQLKLLAELPEVWLALDNDKAGQKALRKTCAYLEEETQVCIIPAPKHAKGDLADLEDAAIHDLIDSRFWSSDINV